MPETQWSRSAVRFTLVERTCQVVVLLLGAICAFLGRNLSFGIDGLAYMDVARAYLRHDWHTAINGYWGPLYSWLLAIGMWVFRPGMRGELVLVHALNFALFAAALFTFSRFWRAIADWSGKISGEEACVPDAAPLAWTLFGYLMFLVTFIWSLDDVTPDILVACIVFAISSRVFNLSAASERGDPKDGVSSYVWLGALLAVGYYAKAILLYFALFILAAALVQGFRSGKLRKPITAAVVFVMLVSPFVALLSRTLGHLSAGDSGRLNYAWFVNGPETKTWMTPADASAPLPFYPGPIANDSPRVFFVPSLRGVTYAPWYDAARFDTRSRPAINLRAQFRQLAANLKFVKEQIIGAEAALLVPLLILVWHTPKPSWRALAATWFCVLPVIAVVGMYLLVHMVMRFVLGFLLVLWGAALAPIYVPPDLHPLARRALLAGILVFAAIELPGLLRYVISQPSVTVERDITIALAIPSYGIRPGDPVASIGDGQEAYWAHWANVPVASEIWKIDSSAFWSGSPTLQQAVLRSIAASGAKAAVWRRDSTRPCPAQWNTLLNDSGCLILLPPGPTVN